MAGELNGKGKDAAVAAITGGVTITGSVECPTELQIGGRIEGDVRCQVLFLEEGGAIAGDVVAERARVAGVIEGTVEAVDVAIESTGRLAGTVTYSRLKISAGGVLDGSVKHRPSEAAPAVEPNGLKLVEAGDARPRRVYVD